MHIFTYDLTKKAIIDNSFRHHYSESEFTKLPVYKIGELFLDFINHDFSYYEQRRKTALQIFEKYSTSDYLKETILLHFPLAKKRLLSLTELTHGSMPNALAFHLVCDLFPCVSYAYIDAESLRESDYTEIRRPRYDYFSLHRDFIENFVPCLDVNICPTIQESLKKYISLSPKMYKTSNEISFKEVTFIRHLVSIFELNDLDYKITANSIDFTLDIEEQFRIRAQQNSIINQQINSTDVEIIHGYSFESIREALTCEFLKMLELNIKIKKCAICDKYFIVNGHDGECCDNLYKDTGLTCQQVFADRNYKNKRKKNPVLKEYDKAYKRMYARYSSKKNLTSDEYAKWKNEAAQERDKALKAYAENPSDTVINNFKQFLNNK